MKYIIEDKLLQVIGNYLAKQPFGEVFEIIGALQKVTPYEEKKENKEKKEDEQQLKNNK